MLLSTKNSTWPYLFRYFAQQMMFISIFRVAQIKASNGQNWAFDFVQLASIFEFNSFWVVPFRERARLQLFSSFHPSSLNKIFKSFAQSIEMWNWFELLYLDFGSYLWLNTVLTFYLFRIMSWFGMIYILPISAIIHQWRSNKTVFLG